MNDEQLEYFLYGVACGAGKVLRDVYPDIAAEQIEEVACSVRNVFTDGLDSDPLERQAVMDAVTSLRGGPEGVWSR